MKICIFIVMDESKIEEIVLKVFEKAKKECASHTKNALSNSISDEIPIASKTIQRAYKRYIEKIVKPNNGSPSAETIDLFCKYLGYDDYKDYAKKSQTTKILFGDSTQRNKTAKEKEENKTKKWIQKIVPTTISFILIILLFIGIKGRFYDELPAVDAKKDTCVIWNKTNYKKVPCGTVYAFKLTSEKLLSFKKITLKRSDNIFDETTGRPLYWYSKTEKGEVEFFNQPGLHPVTRKTLKAITPHIFNKYVPIHNNKPDSFLEK